MNFKNIQLEIAQGVAHLTLNHPPANTLSVETLREISTAVDAIAQNDAVKAAILTGAGKFFCAGAHIKEFPEALGSEEKGEEMARYGQAVCDKIEQLNKPVIAVINGPCLGGGLELALSCHIRLATNDAQLGLPELKLGLIPGFGGTQRLARLTNVALAYEFILTSRVVTGAEAEKIGLVNRALPLDQLMPEAEQLSRLIAEEKSAVSVARAISAIRYGRDATLADGLKREAQLFGELMTTHDATEGVNAFIEKRPATFNDR